MSSEPPLAGRSVLVTGASRGIGLAIAESLTENGAWVGMTARTQPDLERAAALVGGHPIAADLSSVEGAGAIVARLHDLLGGPPDILVNAAGAFSLAGFSDTEPDDFDRQIGTNLRAPFLLIRALLPGMLERRSGHIVNVGSIAGRIPLPGNAAYAASKFGLRGLHEVLATELRGSAIRTTLVEPAATDTPLWDALDPDSRPDLPSRAQMLRAGDVARAVVFALTQPRDVEISFLAVRAV